MYVRYVGVMGVVCIWFVEGSGGYHGFIKGEEFMIPITERLLLHHCGEENNYISQY